MTITKPTVLNENDDLNDQAERHQPAVVDDGYMDRVENDLLRVKEALGIDDDDFCRGIVYQLYRGTRLDFLDLDFNLLVSFLKDARPVDKFHASLLVAAAVCFMQAMRLLQNLSEPMQCDVSPNDMAWALCYGRDVSTLPKRHIKIDNQPLLELSQRAGTRLMGMYVQLLDAANRYPATAASAINVPKVSAAGRRRAIRGVPKNASAVSARRLNGQFAATVTAKPTPEMDSIAVKKSNGPAPTKY
jgi:hypothetical protein